jgi:hypothetical protein
VLQKYSHGGLTEEVKAEFETILSGSVDRHTSETLTPEGERSATSQQQVVSGLETPPAQTLSATHGNGETLHATLPAVTPWENKEQSLAEIKELAGRLQKFCGNSANVRAVRRILHEAQVIELSYRFKRRKGKWKRKKKVARAPKS